MTKCEGLVKTLLNQSIYPIILIDNNSGKLIEHNDQVSKLVSSDDSLNGLIKEIVKDINFEFIFNNDYFYRTIRLNNKTLLTGILINTIDYNSEKVLFIKIYPQKNHYNKYNHHNTLTNFLSDDIYPYFEFDEDYNLLSFNEEFHNIFPDLEITANLLDKLNSDSFIDLTEKLKKEENVFNERILINNKIYYISLIKVKNRIQAFLNQKTLYNKVDRNIDYYKSIEHLISEILNIVEKNKFDKAVCKSLLNIGEFINQDRTYIFNYDKKSNTYSNTYEWCKDYSSSEKENLQNIPAKTFPWWNQKLFNNENIIVPNISELPEEAKAEKEILEAQNIKSLLCVPIFIDEELWGFIGYDSLKKYTFIGREEILILKTVGKILAQARKEKNYKIEFYKFLYSIENIVNNRINTRNEFLQLLYDENLLRKKIEENLQESKKRYEAIVEEQKDLICRIDKSKKVTFVNTSFCNFYNIKKEDIVGNSFLKYIDKKVLKKIKNILYKLNFENNFVFYQEEKNFNGKKRTLEWNIVKICYDHNKVEYQAVGRDITENIQVLRQLERKNNYLKGLIESQQQLIFRTNLSGKLIFTNSSFRDFFDLNSLKVFDKSIFDVIEGKNIQQFYNSFNEIIAHPSVKVFEFKCKVGNHIKWLHCELRMLYLEHSCESEIQGIFYDITSNKEAALIKSKYYKELEENVDQKTKSLQTANKQLKEEMKKRTEIKDRLARSEKRYKSLIDNSIEGVLVISISDETIKFVNQKLSNLFNSSIKDIVGKSLYEFFPSYVTDYIKIQFKLITKGEKNQLTSVPFIKNDNETGYANINFRITQFEDEECVLCYFNDITDKLKIEKDLAKYNIAFKKSTDAIILTDNAGYITDLNLSAVELFKISADYDFLHIKVSEIFPNFKKEELSELIQASLKSDTHKFFEINLINEKGETCPVEISISSMIESGNNLGFVIIGRDISERKKFENELKNSLHEKELLLKEIHHRVKNNLQVINSILSLQSRYLSDDIMLKIIDESQNRIKSMSIIHESLCNSESISKINIRQYIEKLSLYLQHSIPNDNVEIEFDIEDNELSIDLQKATSCGIIINELISNSLKHAFPNDKKGHIIINFKKHNEDFELVVKDNGVGIPHDININKTKSFGLRLIRILCNQLNGNIKLFNGQGTEFKISFPIKKEGSYAE